MNHNNRKNAGFDLVNTNSFWKNNGTSLNNMRSNKKYQIQALSLEKGFSSFV